MKLMNYNLTINWYNLIVATMTIFVWVSNSLLIQRLIK